MWASEPEGGNHEGVLTSVSSVGVINLASLDLSGPTLVVKAQSSSNSQRPTKAYSFGWALDIQRGVDVAVPAAKLTDMFISIQQLLKDGNFSTLNMLLMKAKVNQMPAEGMVALLRYTFGARNHLSSWRDFLRKADAELRARNAPVGTLLQGLQ